MRLPSVERLVREARATLARFPFVLAAASGATVSGLLLIEFEDRTWTWARWLLTAILGLPLFVCLTLTGERRGWSPARQALFGAAGLVGLGVFWLAFAAWTQVGGLTRFFQLALALHLLVAWVPYAWVREPRGYWQYNRALFLRFLTAALYTFVLWAGLSVALVALDQLLGVNVDEETYLRLWVVLVFLFHTWFFLAGVPRDLPALDSRTDYPIGLKVFAQFVLVPIVATYLLILTLYMGRVAITRTWPSGWIGWLVSGVSGLGVLSLLLVHPVAERAENRWIPAYARLFWILLLPSIVMLLLAIWKRIDQYGITERRYFLVVLALWLGGIAVWYTVTRSRELRTIPATLAIVALLTLAGPWGAYAVAQRSQLGRLETLIARAGRLVEGRARPAATEVAFEDRKEISAVLRYLLEAHGTDALEPWFEGELARIDTIGARQEPEPWRAGERTRLIMSWLGVEYVEPWQALAGQPDHFHFVANTGVRVVPIAGYEYAVRVGGARADSARLEGGFLRVELGADSASLHVSRDGARLITIPLGEGLEAARGGPLHSLEPIRIAADSGAVSAVFYLSSASGRRLADGLRLHSFGGDLYLRLE